jgi:hypothetical protein
MASNPPPPIVLVALVLIAACLPRVHAQSAAPPGGQDAARAEWRTLRGHWSATGQRDTLPTERGTDAAVIRLSGAVTLTTSAGLSRGFQGAFLGFFDGASSGVGRVVWTDSDGDRVFAEYRGGPLHAGSAVRLAFTGGSGRYAGIAGEVTLSWQTVVQDEHGAVHVRTTSLEGRYRLAGGEQ